MSASLLSQGGENRNHFRRATVQNGDYLKVIKAWKMIFQSHAVSLVCELIEYSIINLEISFRSPRAQNAAQEKQENEVRDTKLKIPRLITQKVSNQEKFITVKKNKTA